MRRTAWAVVALTVLTLGAYMVPQAGGGGSPAAASGICEAGPAGLAPGAKVVVPIAGPYVLTPNYGRRWGTLHAGMDFASGGSPAILAATAGTVTFAGPASGYGNWIKIAHDGDVVTTYGHMFTEGVLVRVGDVVQAGQQIGRVGTAGDSTGCHLHFEVLTSGSYVDPLLFLNQHGVQIQGAQS